MQIEMYGSGLRAKPFPEYTECYRCLSRAHTLYCLRSLFTLSYQCFFGPSDLSMEWCKRM